MKAAVSVTSSPPSGSAIRVEEVVHTK